MGSIDGKDAREEGTQGSIPPPPGADGGRHAPMWPPAPPGYYPPYGGWYGPPPQEPGAAAPSRRSSKPRMVGILLTLSGVLSIAMGVFMGAMMMNVVPFMAEMESTTNGAGELDGQVIYMNNTPAAGVNVTVVDLGLMASTNETGYYRILNVENGWHDLKIEMPGHKTLVKSVYVKPMEVAGPSSGGMGSGVTKADFQLQPGDGEQRLGEARTPGSKTGPLDDNTRRILQSVGAVCGVLGVVLGLFSILGGYYAFRAERLGVVAIGTLCGILSFGFAIGSVLSVIALILLLLSTDDFERKEKREPARGMQ